MHIAASFTFEALGAASRWSRLLQRPSRHPVHEARAGSAATPSVRVRAYRARAMLAQVRRSVLLLLRSDDCGLPLVLEDVDALDRQLAALGLLPTGLDAAEIALVGHECRQVYREAAENSAHLAGGVKRSPAPPGAPRAASHGLSLRWARARQLQADTEVDVLQCLGARDSRLQLLMRAHVGATPTA